MGRNLFSKFNPVFFKALVLSTTSFLLVLMFQNCSSGGSKINDDSGVNSSTSLPTPGPSPTPSPAIPVQTSIAAADQTAKNNSDCKGLGDFYWEIGDVSGKLGSGQIGTTYTADTSIPIASASKIVFGAFMLQLTNGNLTAVQKSALRMLSGYNGLNPIKCAASSTIANCLSPSSGPNFVFSANEVGMFHYDGAHDEYFATMAAANGGLEIGNYTTAQVNSLVFNTLAINPGFGYAFPLLAGGIDASPTQFAVFLRAILSRKLVIYDFLGADPVCTLPGVSCPTAVSSPSPVEWHYSYNHWVEDDANGDGAFSSTGAFGFYPWISKDKSMYGIISRHSSNPFASSQCGTKLRKAWNTGIAQ